MLKCLGCNLEIELTCHNKKYCNSTCKMRHWRSLNPTYKIREATYFQNNKAKLQKRRSSRHRERYSTDCSYRLKDILRSRLLKAVYKNSKTGSAIKDLGCSIEKFKTYLESKFQPGMTWSNHGKGLDKWNIDHVKPLMIFDLTDPVQFKQAVHYTNLQPIWEVEHYSKTQKDANESFS